MKRSIRSDGLEIVYDDVRGGSPAVVLIHGAFANRGHYAPQVEHLSRSHRVIALDLRGHGDSEAPSGPFGMREAAADVIAVCDAAGVTGAILVGHSWAVPLKVALARPDLAAGVVLLDGAVLLPENVRAEILAGLLPVLEGAGWAAATQGFLGGRGFPYPEPRLKARVLDEIARGPQGLAAQMIRDVMSSDWAAELTAASCPLMYVQGAMPLELNRLPGLRPDALVAAVAGGGHYISLEVPDQVNAMLERFIELVERWDLGAQAGERVRADQPALPEATQAAT